jgi:hypothetical protein
VAGGKAACTVYITLMILSVQTWTFIFVLLDIVKTKPSATESLDVTEYGNAEKARAESPKIIEAIFVRNKTASLYLILLADVFILSPFARF